MKYLILAVLFVSTQVLATELREVNEFLRLELTKGKKQVWRGKNSDNGDCSFRITDGPESSNELRLYVDSGHGGAEVMIGTEGDGKKPTVREFILSRNNELESLSISLTERIRLDGWFRGSETYTNTLKIEKVRNGYYIEGLETKGKFSQKILAHEDCFINDLTYRPKSY